MRQSQRQRGRTLDLFIKRIREAASRLQLTLERIIVRCRLRQEALLEVVRFLQGQLLAQSQLLQLTGV